MTIIIILLCLFVYARWKHGHSVKLVLTEDEARAIRERWVSEALSEFKAGAVVSALLFAVTISAHWEWTIYAGITLVAMLMFSRIVIWIALGVSILAFLVNSVVGQPLCNTAWIAWVQIACVVAIVVRLFGSLMYASHSNTAVIR